MTFYVKLLVCMGVFLRNVYKVEPFNKGHVGTRTFVLYREVSFIRRCNRSWDEYIVLFSLERCLLFVFGSTVYW